MAPISATESGELDAINDRIHDRWFEVNEVTFDKNRGTLSIPFVENGSSASPSASRAIGKSRLEVGNVKQYTLRESEGVGRYDFNVLQFVPHTGVLTIKTGIPLAFEIHVAELSVHVHESSV
jgi:hypothetical protein